MSTRTNLRPQVVINAGSMATTITGPATVLQSLSHASYEVSYVGTAVNGTLSMQVSDSYAIAATGGTANAGNWTTVPMEFNGVVANSVTLTGTSGNGVIDIAPTGVYAIRLVYIAISGTGALTAIVTGKVA